jgi:hypothetical protein
MDDPRLAVYVAALEGDPLLGAQARQAREERQWTKGGGELGANGLEVFDRSEGENLAALRLAWRGGRARPSRTSSARASTRPGAAPPRKLPKSSGCGVTTRRSANDFGVSEQVSPILFVCQDCGSIVDKKKRGRCLPCYRKYERERSRARRAKQGTTKQRGYGIQDERERKRWAPRVQAGLVNCARCGNRIRRGEPWDLDHEDDRRGYLGPSHRGCNRAAPRSKTVLVPSDTGRGASRDW